MRNVRSAVLRGSIVLLLGCTGTYDEVAENSVSATTEGLYTQGTIQLNILYVHGVQNTDSGRLNAHHALSDLQNNVATNMPSWIASYQSTHPGVTINFASAAANLYTATPSPYHPSDSAGPTHMDDWEVGHPGCTTTRQGNPCTTAYEWRYRLVQEINRLFPSNAKNIILVGHSTGARVALEVASNTGPGGVGTYDWGVQSKIASVITLNGMIDGLQTNAYNVVGAMDFVSTCKLGGSLTFIDGIAAPGKGWCEYAGNVGGRAAADWVGQHKRALALISKGSCSPALWTGESDGSLPFAAQGSPYTMGLNMTPAAGQTNTVAYGLGYGTFCHSAITNASDANHATALANGAWRIWEHLFSKAYRVVAQGTQATSSPVPYNGSTPLYTLGYACPAGETTLGPQVVGNCIHPGTFDGDDHPITNGWNVTSTAGTCGGTYQWKQIHDSTEGHNATFWWQARSYLTDGGLVADLPTG